MVRGVTCEAVFHRGVQSCSEPAGETLHIYSSCLGGREEGREGAQENTEEGAGNIKTCKADTQ